MSQCHGVTVAQPPRFLCGCTRLTFGWMARHRTFSWPRRAAAFACVGASPKDLNLLVATSGPVKNVMRISGSRQAPSHECGSVIFENPSLKFTYGRKSAVTFRKINIFSYN